MREQCEERRRSGEFKSMTEVERCADPLVTSAYQEAGYPYMDLIRFAAAARLAGELALAEEPARFIAALEGEAAEPGDE